MNSVTYNTDQLSVLLNKIIPYLSVYNMSSVAIDEEEQLDDTITVVIDKNVDGRFIQVTIKVYDPVSYRLYSHTTEEIPCNDVITSYVDACINLVIDSTYITDTAYSITTALNPCCCIFPMNTTEDAIDVTVDTPVGMTYTLSSNMLHLTATADDDTVQTRELDGVQTINGMSPVNGNIDINGRNPIYVEVKAE